MGTTLRPRSSELSIEGVGQRMQQVVQEGGGEEYAQKGQHQPGERHQLGHVGVVEHLPAAGPDLLVDGDNDVATICLLYTSDAADDLLCVDLGGRRIIKKKKK